MIKKSVFEDELIYGMQREMQSHAKKESMKDLVKAADHLHSALDILEDAGMTAQANKILNILKKIAAEDNQDARHKPRDPRLIPQSRPDQHFADILDMDIDSNSADFNSEKDATFEDSD